MSDMQSALVKQILTMSNNLEKFQKPGRKYTNQEEEAFKKFWKNFYSFLAANNIEINEYFLDNKYTAEQLSDKMKPVTAQLAREEALREANIKKPQKNAEDPTERKNYEKEQEEYERNLEKELEDEERAREELAEMRARQSRLLTQDTQEAISRLSSATLARTSALDVIKAQTYKNKELDYMSADFDIRSYQAASLQLEMDERDDRN